MANVAEKFGLRPYRKLDGTPLVGAQNRYTIASNYGTAIYQGDLVQPTTAGNIERHTPNTSDTVVGVFNGVFYTDPTTQKPTYKNYSMTNTTGVTQTGISKQQLDVSVSGTTATFVVQAIDISQDPDNSDTSNANANVLVRINNHFYRSGTGL